MTPERNRSAAVPQLAPIAAVELAVSQTRSNVYDRDKVAHSKAPLHPSRGNRHEVLRILSKGLPMPVLHVQHSVSNFEGWKRAFESDPMDRKGSGVRRYHVHRSVADPNFVMIDLEFDTLAEAERLLENLRHLWAGPGGTVMRNPEAWIVETVESRSV